MEAKVYIDEDFFNAFDNFQSTDDIGMIDIRTENKNQLINILTNSELNSPISKKYFINLHKKLSQNYSPDNLRDFILFRAFRNNKLKIKDIDLESSNSVFLLKEELKDVATLREHNNIISLGREYDFQSSIIPKTFASAIVDKYMKGIECIKHRCRNVIIIEPYIFQDQPQPKFEPKIPNLILLLKELYLHNDKSNCFLSIITNVLDNDTKIKAKIQQIKDGLKNINLEISVYTHSDGKFNNNRHFITDYSIIDAQHLFDRDDASVSVNYLYDGNINSNFLRVQKLKDKVIASYKVDPEKMGIYTRKFGDILNNPLLK